MRLAFFPRNAAENHAGPPQTAWNLSSHYHECNLAGTYFYFWVIETFWEWSKSALNSSKLPWPSVERCYRQFMVTALDYSLQQLVALYILSVTISSVSQVESSTSFGFRVSYFYFLFLFSFFFRCRQHDWLAVSLHNLRRTWNYVPRVHFAALHTWQSTTG